MKTTSRSALLACLLFAPFAQAEEAPIDQVVVEATRENVLKMAQEVREAEFRFYKRYNELNTKRDYVVNCRNEALTGSRFKWDTCQPVFQDNARKSEGRSFANALQTVSKTPGGIALGSTPGPPASAEISAGRPGFQQNMLDLTRKNPDLAKMLDEYGALLKQYEAAYRKVNGVKAK